MSAVFALAIYATLVVLAALIVWLLDLFYQGYPLLESLTRPALVLILGIVGGALGWTLFAIWSVALA